MRPDAFRLALLLIAGAARSADVAPDDAWLREREGYYAALDRVGLRALAPLLERVFVASAPSGRAPRARPSSRRTATRTPRTRCRSRRATSRPRGARPSGSAGTSRR